MHIEKKSIYFNLQLQEKGEVMVGLLFGVGLLVVLFFSILNLFGIDFDLTIRWNIVLRVVLAILMALFLCFWMSYISATAGAIGLLIGAIVGALIPTLFKVGWKLLTWWMKVILVVFILLGIITAIL